MSSGKELQRTDAATRDDLTKQNARVKDVEIKMAMQRSKWT